MAITNTSELLNQIIDSASFNNIFVENNFPIKINRAKYFSSNKTLLELAISSSSTGTNSIIFVNEYPRSAIQRKIFSSCIIFTTSPPTIDFPTLFCKDLNMLSFFTETALKASMENSLPIVIYLSSNVIMNYVEIKDIKFDKEQINGSLGKDNFFKSLGYKEHLSINRKIDNLFEQTFGKEDNIDFSNVSLSSSTGSFFKYITPTSLREKAQQIQDANGKVFKDDAEYIYSLIGEKDENKLLTTYMEKDYVEYTSYLCPGCPVLYAYLNLPKDYKVATDIQCPAVIKKLNLIPASLEEYAGAFKSGVDQKLAFFGNFTNYKPSLHNLIKDSYSVFYNDNDNQTSAFTSHFSKYISKKGKFNKMAYIENSCNKIEASKPKAVKARKCKCIAQGKLPECIEKTNCPAIHLEKEKAVIIKSLCTGCLSCKIVCPYGAIK